MPAMAVSMLAPGLKADFESHAATELQHADMLAERIQQLGGVPIYQPMEIASQAAAAGVHPEQGPTLSDMVAENLMLERQQVAAYTALVREVGDKDPQRGVSSPVSWKRQKSMPVSWQII